MAYNPQHDLDGETPGLSPDCRVVIGVLDEEQARAAELRRQEDEGLKPKSVLGRPVLDLIVRTYERIRHTEDNK